MNSNPKFITSGGRTQEDLEFWKNKGFITIGVKSTRVVEAAQIRDNCDVSYARTHITEIKVKEIIEKNLSDEIIANEHRVGEIDDCITKIIGKYKFVKAK